MNAAVESIDGLSSRLARYLSDEEIRHIRHAYLYSEQAHDGQKRRSGEPYITHPLQVAEILADMRMDHQSLMAAMLHDVIEDTGIAKDALEHQFGSAVAELVDGVSKLTHISFETRAEAQAENFQKMTLAMARDIRVIIVKLADRLHNMRTIGSLSPEKRRRIARETLDIYSPIANRLGMYELRSELHELAYRAMYPMRIERIERAVSAVSGNRKKIVAEIQEVLESAVTKAGIKARVQGREKAANSIYRKMRDQRKSFTDIMDVYGFRIITDNVDECYRVLGIVHNLYKPKPGRFKDYIAIPKANGYQSLHTTLFGMHGVPIEIQIRTTDMEAMASGGIAAHWLYKTGSEEGAAVQRTNRWVKGLLEIQQRAGSSLEFIENVKIDLFPDDVYIFTPKGRIMELPTGATAVDFAYAVHTDIGNRCVACRIDRALAPLSSVLQSGQTVEIITSKGAKPNLAWLSFVVTGKARSAIRHFLKNQQRSESVHLGHRLLARALANLGGSFEHITPERLDLLLHEAELADLDDVLEEIGLGNRVAYSVARRLLTEREGMPATLSNSGETRPLAIKGSEGLLTSYAKCCRPIPGDPIIGHISKGRGMVIHQEACHNIMDIRDNPEKTVILAWDDDLHGEFYTGLKILVESDPNVIAHIAAAVTDADAAIDRIHRDERDARTSVISLDVGVQDRQHLAAVVRAVRKIKSVVKITRIRT
ncbi:MAG: RelA/SpoT family protein [Litorivicinaceae bacterium]|jgi:GTP diphosphokinase / guanosine-3',5'-bis(diphosphate) 3'-diphosphatase|nr:RelA/SpoT family protein [Litorivicinaceae bacterium]MDP5364232.1 RelA/SpoT family protein [Litorivicinaceae bacterium]